MAGLVLGEVRDNTANMRGFYRDPDGRFVISAANVPMRRGTRGNDGKLVQAVLTTLDPRRAIILVGGRPVDSFDARSPEQALRKARRRPEVKKLWLKR